jgi:hypothetical protein
MSVSSLAGTKWSIQYPGVTKLATIEFSNGPQASLTQPNDQVFPFIWAESPSGDFWMTESSSITQDIFVWIFYGNPSTNPGNIMYINTAPNSYSATPQGCTMSLVQ